MVEMKLGREIIAALAALLLTGCFGSDNDERPVLGIDLEWDTRIDDDRFSGGFCDDPQPEVRWMEWSLVAEALSEDELTDEEIDSLGPGGVVTGGSEDCAEGIDIFDMQPGRYRLEVDGYDEDDVKLWSSACDQIDVRRFDVLYVCDIWAD